MSRWFRHYAGMMSDPKFGAIARRAKASRAEVLFVWGCILENAAENAAASYEWDADLCADLLGCETEHAQRIHDEMERTGIVAGGIVVSWERRQFVSDNSTERSRKHRQHKRNADATLRNADASPPETETETNTTSEANASSVVARKSRPEKPHRGSRIPDDFEFDEKTVAVGRQEGLTDEQIRRELSKFVDWARSATGDRSRKLDWQAAARNWLREAASRLGRAGRTVSSGNGSPSGGRLAAYQRAASAFRRADDDPERGSDLLGGHGHPMGHPH